MEKDYFKQTYCAEKLLCISFFSDAVSTETVQTIRDRESRTSISTFTQLLSSDAVLSCLEIHDRQLVAGLMLARICQTI